MPIHAPYNFVPLAEKIFFPEWGSQVSQDIPFSDGISGELQCTLTAQSPIYVRNGGAEREQIMSNQLNDAQSFFKLGDEYIIPGASLKGMLRNVIEIMSFGKMGRVDDEKYSFRDLTKNHPYLRLMRGAKAGWLTLDEASREWTLTACEFARVDHNDLIKFNPSAAGIKKEQIAKEKYAKWGKSLDIAFDPGVIKPSGVRAANLGGAAAKKKGTIVFTGQPSENDGKKGKKHLEFIFHTKVAKGSIVSLDVMREFENIHKESEDWTFHKSRKVVPVFYHGTSAKPDSIGLAMMYRLPYKYTIHEAIKHTTADHFRPDMDLVEILFGLEGKPEGLKGRVWVSQATAQDAAPGALVNTILNSPKPTYYPNYMEQPDLAYGDYKTLLDSDSKVRGWKRYPARPFQQADVTLPEAEQAAVATKFIPLKKGVQFTFKIKVHNLKPIELGALLWALEWGGDTNLCHGLGMGKAFGFGQVKVAVNATKLIEVTGAGKQKEGLAQLFEQRMDSELGASWRKSPQMHQLFGMADPANAAGKKLKHMTIAAREFITGKIRKERLEPHVSTSVPKPVSTPSQVLKSNLGPVAPLNPVPSAVITVENWKNVQLTFDSVKMEIGVVGKKATAKHTPDKPLVSLQVGFALKSNRVVKANVAVETTDGKEYRITKVEVV